MAILLQGEYRRVRGSPGVRNPVVRLKVTTGTQVSRLFRFYFLILTQTAVGVSQITGGGVSWLIQGLLIPLLKQYRYKIKRSNRKVETMVKDDTVQLEGRTYPCRRLQERRGSQQSVTVVVARLLSTTTDLVASTSRPVSSDAAERSGRYL